ncbi:hypothetical protein Bbelb_365040 [Branchiostoma belcheri]|nr:hypothetical protein Bbelb_365040 [Branchiostoma belcheri]
MRQLESYYLTGPHSRLADYSYLQVETTAPIMASNAANRRSMETAPPSQPAEGNQAPPETPKIMPPDGLEVVETANRSVKLRWTQPVSTNLDQLPSGYKLVAYRVEQRVDKLERPNPWVYNDERIEPTTEFTVVDLTPYEHYQICVRSVLQDNKGELVLNQPYRPRSVRLDDTHGSRKLTWTEPNPAEDVSPESYQYVVESSLHVADNILNAWNKCVVTTRREWKVSVEHSGDYRFRVSTNNTVEEVSSLPQEMRDPEIYIHIETKSSFEWFKEVLWTLFGQHVRRDHGSIIFVISCHDLSSLRELWMNYRLGKVKKFFHHLLARHNELDTKLKVKIKEEDFYACRRHLLLTRPTARGFRVARLGDAPPRGTGLGLSEDFPVYCRPTSHRTTCSQLDFLDPAVPNKQLQGLDHTTSVENLPALPLPSTEVEGVQSELDHTTSESDENLLVLPLTRTEVDSGIYSVPAVVSPLSTCPDSGVELFNVDFKGVEPGPDRTTSESLHVHSHHLPVVSHPIEEDSGVYFGPSRTSSYVPLSRTVTNVQPGPDRTSSESVHSHRPSPLSPVADEPYYSEGSFGVAVPSEDWSSSDTKQKMKFDDVKLQEIVRKQEKEIQQLQETKKNMAAQIEASQLADVPKLREEVRRWKEIAEASQKDLSKRDLEIQQLQETNKDMAARIEKLLHRLTSLQPEPSQLAYVTEHVGLRWTDLARSLGISQVDIEVIEYNNPRDLRECCMDMLTVWQQRTGYSGTVGVLKKALEEAELKDTADNLVVAAMELRGSDEASQKVSSEEKLEIQKLQEIHRNVAGKVEKLTPQDSSLPDHELAYITERVGLMWKPLARSLGISQVDIEVIEYNNPRDLRGCCMDMLTVWRQRASKDATLGVLKKALEEAELMEIADNLAVAAMQLRESDEASQKVSSEEKLEIQKLQEIHRNVAGTVEKLTPQDSSLPDRSQLAYVTEHVGLRWTDLARSLGILQVDIEVIEYNNPRDLRGCCMDMLTVWRQRASKDATLGVLKKALEEAELTTIADNLAVAAMQLRESDEASQKVSSEEKLEIQKLQKIHRNVAGTVEKLTPQDSSLPDPSQLAYIVERVGLMWRDLAWRLGFSEDNIHVIKYNHPRDLRGCCMNMLWEWQKRDDKDATLGVLIKALEEAGLKDIADNLGLKFLGHKLQKVTFGGKGSEPGQFMFSVGVTVSEEGEIFVADLGNQRIQGFTLQGTFVRQFPTVVPGEQDMRPHDVAMDGEGNLWVVGMTYSAEFAVQYDKQGRMLRKIDLQETVWDRGVAVDTRRNHILITQSTEDRGNPHGEVLVFRPDGTLVRTVGGKRKSLLALLLSWQQGMKRPQYITVDREGNIFVSDPYNDSIYVYNEDGQFLFKFGGKGSGEGQLYQPRGICTDRAGNIIVADSENRRVEMFDKTGKFLKHITTDMRRPAAVAMTTQGQLVVTGYWEPKVSIFQNF